MMRTGESRRWAYAAPSTLASLPPRPLGGCPLAQPLQTAPNETEGAAELKRALIGGNKLSLTRRASPNLRTDGEEKAFFRPGDIPKAGPNTSGHPFREFSTREDCPFRPWPEAASPILPVPEQLPVNK